MKLFFWKIITITKERTKTDDVFAMFLSFFLSQHCAAAAQCWLRKKWRKHKLLRIKNHFAVKHGVAITRRNRTGPPCSLGRLTAHSSGGRPARPPAALQTTTDDRQQRAKQYWPIRRASNNVTTYAYYTPISFIVLFLLLILPVFRFLCFIVTDAISWINIYIK